MRVLKSSSGVGAMGGGGGESCLTLFWGLVKAKMGRRGGWCGLGSGRLRLGYLSVFGYLFVFGPFFRFFWLPLRFLVIPLAPPFVFGAVSGSFLRLGRRRRVSVWALEVYVVFEREMRRLRARYTLS